MGLLEASLSCRVPPGGMLTPGDSPTQAKPAPARGVPVFQLAGGMAVRRVAGARRLSQRWWPQGRRRCRVPEAVATGPRCGRNPMSEHLPSHAPECRQFLDQGGVGRFVFTEAHQGLVE